MSLNDLVVLKKFAEEAPRLSAVALASTTKIGVLIKIYENQELFMMVEARSEIYDSFADALYKFEEGGKLLIHLTDLDLYCLFDLDRYSSFVDSVSFLAKTTEVNVRQIVLSGMEQKLVIKCTNADFTDDIREHAEKCFKTSATMLDGEITVDVLTGSEAEIAEKYKKLYDYIDEHDDYYCCNAMAQFNTTRHNHYKFRSYSFNDTIELDRNASTPDKLYGMFRSQGKYPSQVVDKLAAKSHGDKPYVDKLNFVVEEPFRQRVRVGGTYNGCRCLEALQADYPEELKIYKSIPCDDVDDVVELERILHARLENRKLLGGWFKLSKKEAYSLIAEFTV